MRTILFSLGLLFIVLNGFTQQVAKSLTYKNTFVGFYEYKPTNYNPNKKYPLIIFLHGIGERGNGTTELPYLLWQGIPKNIAEGKTMTFTVNGKTETFLVLSPQLPKWLGAWDNVYVDAMLDYAKKNLNVDDKRVFLTGLSLGGGGVWSYVTSSLQNAKKFAAIAPICGVCYYDLKQLEPTVGKADIGVWGFANMDDNIVSPWCTISAIDELSRKKSKKIKKTINQWGGHDAWTQAYDVGHSIHKPNLYEWFLSEADSDDDDDDDDDRDNQSGSGQLPVNAAPVAKAGDDVAITLPANEITLNNSGSYDSDGTIKGWNWTKVSGPGQPSIVSANNASTTVRNLVAGNYVFRLTVTDNMNATATDDVAVTVNAAKNAAPVAKAGNDVAITLPDNNVTLSNSGSYDSDGNIKGWNWSKISGPSQFNIVAANNASTEVKNLQAGTYVFRLTVTDNDNETDTDDITVIVNRAPNAAPVAKAGSDISLTLPSNSTTLSNAGSYDADGSIKSYSWTKISGPSRFELTNPNGASTDLRNLEVGSYTFRLTVTDDDGATASDDVTINVNRAPNVAPVAKAGNDASITLPANAVTLSNAGSYDADGTIRGYSWTKVSGPSQFSIANANSASTEVRNLEAGSYTFRLTVTDDDGATASDDITINVNRAPNVAPVAKAGNDINITLPTNTITLNNAGSYDADGSIKGFSWTKISGPSQFTITSPNAASTSVNNLHAGGYIFRLTVTDDDGATASDDVMVVVAPEPVVTKPPVAVAGKDEKIPIGQATVLRGENSYAQGTSIRSYQWTKYAGPASHEILTPNAQNTWIRNMEEGVYIYRLTVTDNNGVVDTDDVMITVKGTLPVALAGKDETIPVGQATVLRGDNSYVLGGTIRSYTWTKLSGPASYEIIDPNSKTTWIRKMTAGVYVYRLTIRDNNGYEGVDDVTITVHGASVVANAGKDETIPQGQATVLNGDGSYSNGGNIRSYTWTKTSGPGSLEILTPESKNTWVRNMVPGVYTFRLTVTDNEGAVGYDDVNIIVSQPVSVAARGEIQSSGQDLTPLEMAQGAITTSQKLTVYPNPVINSLNIRWSGDQKGNATINIVDAGGRVVKTVKVKKENLDFNTSMEVNSLVPGLYTIQILLQNGKPLNKQFLKR
jgi:hypothetical protein